MIPSTRALLVLRAVARYGGLRAAGRELGLTQSAISHQLGSLETVLGQALVKRRGRGMVLTDAGLDYLGRAEPALEALEEATRSIAQRDFAATFSISAPPSFLSSWLIPNLSVVRTRLARTTIHLSQALTVDSSATGVDLAIEYRQHAATDVDTVALFSDDLAVYAAPDYVEAAHVKGPSDLGEATLIETERRQSSWRDVLEGSTNHQPLIVVPYSFHAFEAARCGLGLALGNRLNAYPYVRGGDLIEVWQAPTPPKKRLPRYFATIPRSVERRERAETIRSWLVSAVRPSFRTNSNGDG